MKTEIRKQNKLIRSSMPKEEVAEKSLIASKHFLSSSMYKESRVVMLYMPLGNETDTSLIMQTALCDAKKIILPVCDTENIDIIPCEVTKDTDYIKGSYSINEPKELIIADEEKIDIVLVPGIAFDKKGERIGFGKGYYDKFLMRTDAVKVGFCYDFQLLESIPSEEHDICVDYVITEKSVYNVKFK